MREAIDYNALSWIRQEVGVTLKQARLELEEYAERDQRKELLQGCAAHLHEARGPLQMVSIKGADMLACEMEEAIADLLLDAVVDKESLLEQLMQGFLELPDYLSNLRSGKRDNPKLLFPLINSLRASRGQQPLKEDSVFSPDLSAAMPASEFDAGAEPAEQDSVTLARTSRVRFQGGLLEWYRDSSSNHGLQILVEVLEHLQHTARSEPAARVWWVGAGVAELLRDGVISAGPAMKRLFSQLDRQIKRLMDSGESVFADVLSEDLLTNLLQQLVGVTTDSPRVRQIRATYAIASQDNAAPPSNTDDLDIGEELLQTVSSTARDAVDHIKEQVDSLMREPREMSESLVTIADDLHSLGNTLGMIGMERLGDRLAQEEQHLRHLAVADDAADNPDFSGLANTLVAVEDALTDIVMHASGNDADGGHGDAVLRQGQQAVISAVIADIAAAKEAINEFLKSSGEFGLLESAPVLLNKICGGLELVGEERLAVAARQVKQFIAAELIERRRQLDEEELDSLADAICSIEYCVEELGENHKFGDRAIGVAMDSLRKLGYSMAEPGVSVPHPVDEVGIQAKAHSDNDEPVVDGAEHRVMPESVEPEAVRSEPIAEQEQEDSTSEQHAIKEHAGIGELQIVAPDADSEIVDIFIEEAGEVLDRLAVDIPAWIMNPDDRETLAEIRRAFHTIKGSGRMIGAMAAGELAWSYENLLNRVIEGAIPAGAAIFDLVGQAIPVMKDLVAQVKNPDTILLADISALGRKAAELSRPGAYTGEPMLAGAVAENGADSLTIAEGAQETVAEAAHLQDDLTTPVEVVHVEIVDASPDVPGWENTADLPQSESHAEDAVAQAATELSAEPPDVAAAAHPGDVRDYTVEAGTEAAAENAAVDLPVLKHGSDQEIVEIFLEEAGEELASISLQIPEWILRPEDTRLLEDVRRSLHTLKGSGRMAGAMLAGEFAWSMESLLNRVIEGAVQPGGALFALLSQVPEAVSGLLRQLQDGTEPDSDIAGMMQKAAGISGARGGEPEEYPEVAAQVGMDSEYTVPAEEDDDAVLLDLYSNECREHLGALAGGIPEMRETGLVTEAQYRALHTLTGISESASVPGIGRLAAALYDYFGELYQEGRATVPDAVVVLEDCVREMNEQLERLPDRGYAEPAVATLLDRIGAVSVMPLPVEDGVTAVPDAGEMLADSADVEADSIDDIPELPAVAMPDYEAPAAEADALESGSGEMAAKVVYEMDAAAGDENRPVMAESAQPDEDIYSGIDQELYEIFVEEATEIIDSSEGALRSWSEAPDDREQMADFQRLLHTLKGGARMVDIVAIGNLSHSLESLLTLVSDGAVPANEDLFSLLQESHDRLAEMLEKVKSRAVIDPAHDLEARLEAFKRGEPADTAAGSNDTGQSAIELSAAAVPAGTGFTSSGSGSRAGEQPDDAGGEYEDAGFVAHLAFDEPDDDAGRMAQALAAQPQMVERRKEGRARSELVRVQSDVLDSLVNNAGEINIYRARMEQQISNFRFNLTEFDQTISRLRDQLRQLEIETEAQILFRYEQESESRNQDFDPLEMDRYSKLQQLSRSLIESISDLRSLQGLMDATTRDSETLLLQQSRVSTDLQEGLIRTRMIPFAGLAPRLRRIVRQAARQLDKKVDLHLRGAEGEMDRAVIERIVAPLEHMLRNAVAHGIESPDQRRQAGKRVAGTITIEFNREGTEIVLRISDDGAGLDIDAIRKRAIERGLMTAGMDLPDSDVMQFVLQTGFSTASEVTQISGRGVGMDVVNSEVKQLGGSLHIDSRAGEGSVFTVRLPYTLAINQALLVTVSDQVFCVPMSSIEGVVTASSEQLRTCYSEDSQEFGYAGHNYQLMHLGSLLGISRMDLSNAGNQIPVLLVRVGDKRIGVQIDALLGSREVVIKPLGAQLSMVDGITGATILGDGRVVMILDMFAVSRMKVREQMPVQPAALQDDGRLVVMVVDDSITVRKVTSRLLERSSYRVLTAKDGVDAMGQLQEVVPDMMLLDIEMPRMDGFELATHMRNDERLKHVPIIMITSRTGDKHRERAFEIGVNEYLGKPYQESELLASINRILGVTTIAVGVQ